MTRNDPFVSTETGVADGGDAIVDGSSAGTGAAEVTELGGSGGVTIYREIDPNGDGTFEISEQLDQTSGLWHTQLNELLVSQSKNVRLRINNISGGTIDVYGIGVEVDDA
jgi:hypothetical protein